MVAAIGVGTMRRRGGEGCGTDDERDKGAVVVRWESSAQGRLGASYGICSWSCQVRLHKEGVGFLILFRATMGPKMAAVDGRKWCILKDSSAEGTWRNWRH